ncbi:S-layer homology domain-containing protein [Oscillospiraceae bacterium 50-16]
MRKKINNKVVSIVVALALVCGVVMSAFAANDYVNPTFTDVPKSHWAYTFVEKAVEKGWVSGMGDGTFAPNANVTYSQFCVMLVRTFYNEDYESYDGPKGAWYVPFTTIASQKGLLDGTNVVGHETDEDYVGQFMNRYEMALMAANTLKKINAKLPSASEQADQMDKTPDYWDIPKQYRNAVLLAKACGVLSGMDSAGTFGGTGNLNRAQACVVLIKLDEMKDTGDGSGDNTGDNTGDTPTEITRSPFAFQGSENVQQMMDRLNAEAPKYYEGYLTNGKPITEENIKAMLAEAEKGMPDGTAWDASSQYRYGRPNFYPGTSGSTGCNSFAAALSDYVFGLKASVTVHQDFDNLKVGDVIWWKDSSDGYNHVVFVTDTRSAADYTCCSGNSNKSVWWGRNDNVNAWSQTQRAETYVYSRY